MPNWCDNYLQADGGRKDLDAFLAECFSKNEYERVFLDFEKIVPLGEPGDDWFEKHCDKWGTKWNINECDIEDNDNSLTVWFETAWTPPIPVMEVLTQKYKALLFTLEYNEGGCGFRGVFEGRQGETIRDDCWNMTHEDMVELGWQDEDEDEATSVKL